MSQDKHALKDGKYSSLQALENAMPNRTEWRYEMRREAQEIMPGVYVGPFQPSCRLDQLQALGITNILCISEARESQFYKARFPDHFTYLLVEMRDANDQNLIRIFPQTQEFIEQAILAGGKVLVHCGDGIGRSPAVVTAYVMSKALVSHEDAFSFVQRRRFCIAPRMEFQHQLEAYSSIVKAHLAMASDKGAQVGQRERRRAREDSEEPERNGGDDTESTLPSSISHNDADMTIMYTATAKKGSRNRMGD